jgi:hypothetical protein
MLNQKTNTILRWVIFGAIILAGIFFVLTSATAVRLTDSQRILGKWQKLNPLHNNLFIEFKSDGTLLDDTAFSTLKGTYKLLDDRRIDMEIQGQIMGTNKAIIRYEITGDELLLTPDTGAGIAQRCRRVQ